MPALPPNVVISEDIYAMLLTIHQQANWRQRCLSACRKKARIRSMKSLMRPCVRPHLGDHLDGSQGCHGALSICASVAVRRALIQNNCELVTPPFAQARPIR